MATQTIHRTALRSVIVNLYKHNFLIIVSFKRGEEEVGECGKATTLDGERTPPYQFNASENVVKIQLKTIENKLVNNPFLKETARFQPRPLLRANFKFNV